MGWTGRSDWETACRRGKFVRVAAGHPVGYFSASTLSRPWIVPLSGATDRLDRFFDAFHRHRPVDASFIGVHEHDGRLPDLSEAGLGDTLSDVEALLGEFEAARAEIGPQPLAADPVALDGALARGVLRQHRWELTGPHFFGGNPSLPPGEAVFGFLSLFLTHGGSLAHRVEAARERLAAIPGFLADARSLVGVAPADWTARAVRECHGALLLLGEGVDLLADELGLGRDTFRGPADRASTAFAEHRAWLESLPAIPAPAAGPEALDLYLRDGHHLEDSADEMVRYARAELDEATARTRADAAALGFASVADALAALRERHPSMAEYLPRYQRTWDEVRALTDEKALVTWPDLPIRYRPRPAWLRAAAPHFYFLFYRSPAAVRRPPVHEYLVTPIDDATPEAEREALLRAHDDSVIKLNHVVHHGGIGHHVQNWNAFRAASRIGRVAAVDGASRIAMPCGGTMAEGWACYATDLVAEFGGLTPLEALAERHGRARMCARAVVDLEFHRGRMGLDEAVAFYVQHAGMTPAAARGEATKNSMLPGMAVMYLAGTDGIHRLRREVRAIEGAAFDLRRFHDTFLAFGSVPVSLIGEAMRAEAREIDR